VSKQKDFIGEDGKFSHAFIYDLFVDQEVDSRPPVLHEVTGYIQYYSLINREKKNNLTRLYDYLRFYRGRREGKKDFLRFLI
jgi:hypothetical protein